MKKKFLLSYVSKFFKNKKKLIRKSRFNLITILVFEIIAFVCLYYLRYKNQNRAFTGFELKAGNVISIIFFSILFLLILISLFFAKSIGATSSFFLLFNSITGLTSLIASDFILQKEIKIILDSIFLVCNLFLISALLQILFSKEKHFRFFRAVLIFFMILSVSVFSVFIYVLNFQDDYEKYLNGKTKANAAVILGAAVWGGNRPSPVLKERIDKGFEIYQKGLVDKIVITGGGSPNELTEGEVSKNVLLKYGVVPDDLFLENESNSTIEQIQFVRDSLFYSNNWDRIILISDNFHLPRAVEICDFNNISADCISSDREISSFGTISYCFKESLALIIFWIFGI